VTAAVIFGGLAVLSLGLVLWQFVCAMKFPLHQRLAHPRFAPDISILKPLKGADVHTRACLESWMIQSYAGRTQILFGVNSPEDPVCALVRELLLAHPQVDAQLVICAQRLGPNAKVSTLIQLQPLAKHEVIGVSDADVRVPADFLAQAVAPLENKGVGLVNCFYKLANPQNGEMRCEAFMVNGDFWSQVLQARSLKPIDFALGAVMITTQARLRPIGAFASLVDYLADDYRLGNQIARGGGEIVITPVVAECWSAAMTAREVWQHQLRWARTVRVCQPVPYFFSILNDVTVWSCVWAMSSMTLGVRAAVGAFLAIRCVTAIITERKLTGRFSTDSAAVALICDVVRPVLWALSLIGNTVSWRGKKYRVIRGGKLVRIEG
jgi:ceramide glucosyltransferase